MSFNLKKICVTKLCYVKSCYEPAVSVRTVTRISVLLQYLASTCRREVHWINHH